MNRRPSKSRSSYDAFSSSRTGGFRAASPDASFFEEKKRPRPLRRILLALLAALALTLVVNTAVNQFVFVRRVSVPVKGLAPSFEGYTFLQISDLKGALYGGNQGLLRMALADEAYDAVLLTGDMISPLGNAVPFYSLLSVLRELAPQTPVYFIAGDTDPVPLSMTYAPSGSPFAPWVLGAQQRGAQHLTAPVPIEREGQTLWLTPGSLLHLDVDTMQGQYEARYLSAAASGDENAIELAAHALKQLEDIRAARRATKEEDIVISVTHAPPTDDDLKTYAGAVDLVLCGHTLGGLIRLPLAGALFIPSQTLPRWGLLPGKAAGSGLLQDTTPRVYISPGLGKQDERYPPFFFRLFNPPSVSLITLTQSTM
ncbi:MAG: metallophosphoesterase [Clostridia bacterium]|nr:metallophosphoesterase [Clostridia bacterium]